MLTRKERAVMGVAYALCGKDGRCLISVRDFLARLPKREKTDDEGLERTLKALEMDDYFDLCFSERKGEKMFVITLHGKGLAFRRLAEQEKRNAYGKLFWAVVSAVATFLVGVLLKRIF